MVEPAIAVSLLASDPLNHASAIRQAQSAGVDIVHLDVMDGHFVPNLSFGLATVAASKRLTRLTIEVHLMISNPDTTLDRYLEAGADRIIFHLEASSSIDTSIRQIVNSGRQVGLAIKPKTPIDLLFPYLAELDMVTVMTVEPGFSGQQFMPAMLSKIKHLCRHCQDRGLTTVIEVDGGINAETASLSVANGAKTLVVGAYFYGNDNRSQLVENLKSLRVTE